MPRAAERDTAVSYSVIQAFLSNYCLFSLQQLLHVKTWTRFYYLRGPSEADLPVPRRSQRTGRAHLRQLFARPRGPTRCGCGARASYRASSYKSQVIKCAVQAQTSPRYCHSTLLRREDTWTVLAPHLANCPRGGPTSLYPHTSSSGSLELHLRATHSISAHLPSSPCPSHNLLLIEARPSTFEASPPTFVHLPNQLRSSPS